MIEVGELIALTVCTDCYAEDKLQDFVYTQMKTKRMTKNAANDGLNKKTEVEKKEKKKCFHQEKHKKVKKCCRKSKKLLFTSIQYSSLNGIFQNHQKKV